MTIKYRTVKTVYIVVRTHVDDVQAVGAYQTLQEAIDMQDAYNQQVEDGDLSKDFHFDVQLTTLYIK